MRPAGPWGWMRVGFCATQAVELARQAAQVVDAARHPGVNFGAGVLHRFDGLPVPAWALWLPWALAAGGLAVLAGGGPRARAGLVLWMVAEVTLFCTGGWEINAPERVAAWAAVSLGLGLPGEALRRGVDPPPPQEQDPWPRRFLLAWMAAMYGMAAGMKLHEPGWHDGTVLAQALLDPWMGGTSLGAWIASRAGLCAALGWVAVFLELLVAVGILVPRLNPWALAAGAGFHLCVGALVSVGTLGWTVLACYPVALSPQAWDRLHAASGRVLRRDA